MDVIQEHASNKSYWTKYKAHPKKIPSHITPAQHANLITQVNVNDTNDVVYFFSHLEHKADKKTPLSSEVLKSADNSARLKLESLLDIDQTTANHFVAKCNRTIKLMASTNVSIAGRSLSELQNFAEKSRFLTVALFNKPQLISAKKEVQNRVLKELYQFHKDDLEIYDLAAKHFKNRDNNINLQQNKPGLSNYLFSADNVKKRIQRNCNLEFLRHHQKQYAQFLNKDDLAYIFGLEKPEQHRYFYETLKSFLHHKPNEMSQLFDEIANEEINQHDKLPDNPIKQGKYNLRRHLFHADHLVNEVEETKKSLIKHLNEKCANLLIKHIDKSKPLYSSSADSTLNTKLSANINKILSLTQYSPDQSYLFATELAKANANNLPVLTRLVTTVGSILNKKLFNTWWKDLNSNGIIPDIKNYLLPDSFNNSNKNPDLEIMNEVIVQNHVREKINFSLHKDINEIIKLINHNGLKPLSLKALVNDERLKPALQSYYKENSAYKELMNQFIQKSPHLYCLMKNISIIDLLLNRKLKVKEADINEFHQIFDSKLLEFHIREDEILIDQLLKETRAEALQLGKLALNSPSITKTILDKGYLNKIFNKEYITQQQEEFALHFLAWISNNQINEEVKAYAIEFFYYHTTITQQHQFSQQFPDLGKHLFHVQQNKHQRWLLQPDGSVFDLNLTNKNVSVYVNELINSNQQHAYPALLKAIIYIAHHTPLRLTEFLNHKLSLFGNVTIQHCIQNYLAVCLNSIDDDAHFELRHDIEQCIKMPKLHDLITDTDEKLYLLSKSTKLDNSCFKAFSLSIHNRLSDYISRSNQPDHLKYHERERIQTLSPYFHVQALSSNRHLDVLSALILENNVDEIDLQSFKKFSVDQINNLIEHDVELRSKIIEQLSHAKAITHDKKMAILAKYPSLILFLLFEHKLNGQELISIGLKFPDYHIPQNDSEFIKILEYIQSSACSNHEKLQGEDLLGNMINKDVNTTLIESYQKLVSIKSPFVSKLNNLIIEKVTTNNRLLVYANTLPMLAPVIIQKIIQSGHEIDETTINFLDKNHELVANLDIQVLRNIFLSDHCHEAFLTKYPQIIERILDEPIIDFITPILQQEKHIDKLVNSVVNNPSALTKFFNHPIIILALFTSATFYSKVLKVNDLRLLMNQSCDRFINYYIDENFDQHADQILLSINHHANIIIEKIKSINDGKRLFDIVNKLPSYRRMILSDPSSAITGYDYCIKQLQTNALDGSMEAWLHDLLQNYLAPLDTYIDNLSKINQGARLIATWLKDDTNTLFDRISHSIFTHEAVLYHYLELVKFAIHPNFITNTASLMNSLINAKEYKDQFSKLFQANPVNSIVFIKNLSIEQRINLLLAYPILETVFLENSALLWSDSMQENIDHYKQLSQTNIACANQFRERILLKSDPITSLIQYEDQLPELTALILDRLILTIKNYQQYASKYTHSMTMRLAFLNKPEYIELLIENNQASVINWLDNKEFIERLDIQVLNNILSYNHSDANIKIINYLDKKDDILDQIDVNNLKIIFSSNDCHLDYLKNNSIIVAKLLATKDHINDLNEIVDQPELLAKFLSAIDGNVTLLTALENVIKNNFNLALQLFKSDHFSTQWITASKQALIHLFEQSAFYNRLTEQDNYPVLLKLYKESDNETKNAFWSACKTHHQLAMAIITSNELTEEMVTQHPEVFSKLLNTSLLDEVLDYKKLSILLSANNNEISTLILHNPIFKIQLGKNNHKYTPAQETLLIEHESKAIHEIEDVFLVVDKYPAKENNQLLLKLREANTGLFDQAYQYAQHAVSDTLKCKFETLYANIQLDKNDQFTNYFKTHNNKKLDDTNNNHHDQHDQLNNFKSIIAKLHADNNKNHNRSFKGIFSSRRSPTETQLQTARNYLNDDTIKNAYIANRYCLDLFNLDKTNVSFRQILSDSLPNLLTEAWQLFKDKKYVLALEYLSTLSTTYEALQIKKDSVLLRAKLLELDIHIQTNHQNTDYFQLKELLSLFDNWDETIFSQLSVNLLDNDGFYNFLKMELSYDKPYAIKWLNAIANQPHLSSMAQDKVKQLQFEIKLSEFDNLTSDLYSSVAKYQATQWMQENADALIANINSFSRRNISLDIVLATKDIKLITCLLRKKYLADEWVSAGNVHHTIQLLTDLKKSDLNLCRSIIKCFYFYTHLKIENPELILSFQAFLDHHHDIKQHTKHEYDNFYNPYTIGMKLVEAPTVQPEIRYVYRDVFIQTNQNEPITPADPAAQTAPISPVEVEPVVASAPPPPPPPMMAAPSDKGKQKSSIFNDLIKRLEIITKMTPSKFIKTFFHYDDDPVSPPQHKITVFNDKISPSLSILIEKIKNDELKDSDSAYEYFKTIDNTLIHLRTGEEFETLNPSNFEFYKTNYFDKLYQKFIEQITRDRVDSLSFLSDQDHIKPLINIFHPKPFIGLSADFDLYVKPILGKIFETCRTKNEFDANKEFENFKQLLIASKSTHFGKVPLENTSPELLKEKFNNIFDVFINQSKKTPKKLNTTLTLFKPSSEKQAPITMADLGKVKLQPAEKRILADKPVKKNNQVTLKPVNNPDNNQVPSSQASHSSTEQDLGTAMKDAILRRRINLQEEDVPSNDSDNSFSDDDTQQLTFKPGGPR